MGSRATSILSHLDSVEAARSAARADAALAVGVAAVKRYQARRFERSYADWLEQANSRRACRFFLDELYGDKDFGRRDAEFARVVPALVRLFPDEVTATVESLSALHALSEDLDLRMGRNLASPAAGAAPTLDPETYLRIWQATGEPTERERQVRLMLEVGTAMTQHTRKPLLRRSLKFMRGPAALAGLSALQDFLEEGFDAFAELREPKAFLDSVATRERALMNRLFAARHAQPEGRDDPLAQLPTDR